MKFSAMTLRSCIDLAEKIGIITEAHLYGSDYISVEGVTHQNGRPFAISMHLREDKENGTEELE